MKYNPFKKIMVSLLSLFVLFSVVQTSAQQTQQEKDFAVKLLTDTREDVLKASKNLSNAQLSFKTAADKWSAEDCIKHIAASETTLWVMVEDALKKPVNPSDRASIKVTDQDLVKAVEDRTNKSKTFAALEPANSPYKTVEEALTAFKENREKLINFIKTTNADLRNHVMVLPLGTFDAYQFILLIAAHSNRHTQQMEEVKAAANFPIK